MTCKSCNGTKRVQLLTSWVDCTDCPPPEGGERPTNSYLKRFESKVDWRRVIKDDPVFQVKKDETVLNPASILQGDRMTQWKKSLPSVLLEGNDRIQGGDTIWLRPDGAASNLHHPTYTPLGVAEMAAEAGEVVVICDFRNNYFHMMVAF